MIYLSWKEFEMDSNKNNKLRKSVNSPIPYYLVAFFWVICALFFPMYKIIHFLIIGALSVAVYILGTKKFKPTIIYVDKPVDPVMSGDSTVDSLLKTGRESVAKLRQLNDLIPGADPSIKLDRLEAISSSIFDVVAGNPSKASKIRRFVNYYLPATIKMMETYKTISAHDVKGPNITSTLANIESALDSLVAAFEKQLDTLYSDTALDISTDIDVLESIFAQEGLKESDFI